jgi:hypothetical protein
MNPTRSHWIVAGSMAAAAVATAIMAASALSGFGGSASGDLPASMSAFSTAILAVGMLIILGLESTHQSRRRARRAGMSRMGDLLPITPAPSTNG